MNRPRADGNGARRRRGGGFTLIEMLVALSIFSFIGVAAYQLLSSTGRLQESGETRFRALAGLQSAMRQFDEDLTQFAPRAVPRASGKPDPALNTGPGEFAIEFTRAGWRNPLGAPRSSLQRVAWLVDDENRLVRRYRRALDDADPGEVVERVVAEGVDELAFRYLDERGGWHEDWPPEGRVGDPASDAGPAQPGTAQQPAAEPVPVAIEVRMVHRQIGEIRRVVALR